MTFSNYTLPVLTVNNFLWHTMKSVEPTFQKKYGSKIPFFPLSDAASGSKAWEDKTYVVYDRIIKTTPSPFYPIKKEHILYAVKGKEVETLEWGMAIQYILDRMDDAAQDINSWNRSQQNPSSVYFHNLRVFQTDFSNSRDFSNRPYYITKFIVEAQYHLTDLL